MKNTKISKFVATGSVDGMIIGRPYNIKEIKYGRFNYGGYSCFNYTYMPIPKKLHYAIYLGHDIQKIYFKLMATHDLATRKVDLPHTPIPYMSTHITELSITDADFVVDYINLNSYVLIPQSYVDSDDKKITYNTPTPKFKYDDTKLHFLTIGDMYADESLPVTVSESVEIINPDIFSKFEKIHVVLANGTVEAKSYSVDEIIIGKEHIEFGDNFKLTLDELKSDKIDICGNVINIHKGGEHDD